MTLTKRIVIAVVCFALIVSAIVLGVSIKPVAGAGNGRDYAVTDLTDFNNVLKSLQENKNASLKHTTAREATPLKESTPQFASFTVIETTDAYTTSQSSSYWSINSHFGSTTSSGSSSQSAKNSLSRTLEIYVAEDGVYYRSEGRLASYSESSSNSSSKKTTRFTKQSMDFKIHVYIDKKQILLYLEQFDFSYRYETTDSSDTKQNVSKTEQDEQINVLQNYLNQWIDCTAHPEIANTFLNVNSTNMQTLSSFSELIEEELESEEKIFRVQNGIYTLKQDPFAKFLGIKKEQQDKIDGKCVIDLSNQKKPVLDYQAKIDFEDSDKTETDYGSSNSNATSYGYISDRYQFKNIDNTVIRKINADTIDLEDILENMEESK